MSYSPTLTDYNELEKALLAVEATFTPAEAHGYICGVLSATGGKLDASWIKVIMGKSKNVSLREMLLELFETTFHLLNEFSFEFTLLLPDDKVDINKRSESLGMWCQGFLTGLQKHNIPLKNRDPGEVTEALEDITEIAQISFGDIADNDEDENAYFELVEYVRLATLMLFHELTAPSPKNREGDETDD